MPFRLLIPVAAAAAVVLAAVLAAWSPELGRTELRWSPLTVGVMLVLIVGMAEGVHRLCRWTTAQALTTLASNTAALMVLLGLRLAYFTPEYERPVETWRQWPISTTVNAGAVSFGLLALAVAGELGWRMWGRRARPRLR